MQIQRHIHWPDKSFFLFGPRGTGKTTWLEHTFKNAHFINLLKTEQFLKFSREPSLFRKIVETLPVHQWVVVDEVQKIPMLLDEVHELLHQSQNKRKFVLTGSSARKLKQAQANMLAGRALKKECYPITLSELGDFQIEEILKFGALPMSITAPSSQEKIDYLESYCATYLKEEIQQEALVKNLDGFFRFLQICGIMNGQILNISNISNDAGIGRTTVNGHFDILVDTLIGFKLPAWRKKIKVKEIAHPKFYLFDSGVTRALSGKIRSEIETQEKGFLFETLVLNELRAFNAYQNLGGEFFYWNAPPRSEVDIIWSQGNTHIGFEIKTATRWKSEYSKSLNELISEKYLSKGYGVYLGEDEFKDGHVHILPIKTFVKKMKDCF